jgi:plasmid maintenance system antidote protein VapI
MNKGQQQLAAWMDERGTPKSWLAVAMDVNRATINAWLANTAKPDAPNRFRLERVCGIDPQAWGEVVE